MVNIKHSPGFPDAVQLGKYVSASEKMSDFAIYVYFLKCVDSFIHYRVSTLNKIQTLCVHTVTAEKKQSLKMYHRERTLKQKKELPFSVVCVQQCC